MASKVSDPRGIAVYGATSLTSSQPLSRQGVGSSGYVPNSASHQKGNLVKGQVLFSVGNCKVKQLFDMLLHNSCDTILHIQENPALSRNFFKWLKPGGKDLISDYCKSSETTSPEFSEYIN
ncbi:hypothetical protein Bca52824_030582 [Brassica carinata]|uniref:Uncharacterized protein n=1 Tax=Brassica carinata TaxID=52824 RepID=A0A8X7S953_BRACI|nr:hypothetical protein Bca52824_030582 [Brassica carinata]